MVSNRLRAREARRVQGRLSALMMFLEIFLVVLFNVPRRIEYSDSLTGSQPQAQLTSDRVLMPLWRGYERSNEMKRKPRRDAVRRRAALPR
jgi:hypothetical protein